MSSIRTSPSVRTRELVAPATWSRKPERSVPLSLASPPSPAPIDARDAAALVLTAIILGFRKVAAVQAKLYEKRKWRLIGDNVFLGLLGTSGAWCVSIKTALSYGLGAALGTLYLVLLARYVQNLGKEGGSGGSARLALAVLLVLLATKNKGTLELIPSVMGFLTYQVSLEWREGTDRCPPPRSPAPVLCPAQPGRPLAASRHAREGSSSLRRQVPTRGAPAGVCLTSSHGLVPRRCL